MKVIWTKKAVSNQAHLPGEGTLANTWTNYKAVVTSNGLSPAGRSPDLGFTTLTADQPGTWPVKRSRENIGVT